MPKPAVGTLVRDWRVRRRRSQMDLALDVGVSPRHLSFVETGRSRPSPELVLAIADRLDVPLRERNTLLLVAGYAPRYPQHGIDDEAMRPVRASIQRMLDAHDPYPGVVIDRQWNIVLANAAAARLTAGLGPDALRPPLNVYRLCLHPDGLARHTLNLTEWATYLLTQLRRTIALTGDPDLQELEAELLTHPHVAAVDAGAPNAGDRDARSEADELLVPLRLELGGRRLSLFTTLTTFGTPRDITLDELAVELFFPADDETAQVLREHAPSAATPSAS